MLAFSAYTMDLEKPAIVRRPPDAGKTLMGLEDQDYGLNGLARAQSTRGPRAGVKGKRARPAPGAARSARFARGGLRGRSGRGLTGPAGLHPQRAEPGLGLADDVGGEVRQPFGREGAQR